MTVPVTLRPLWLNANTGTYGAWDQRSQSEFAPGEGVADVNSFKILQRQAGAAMQIDIGATGIGLQRAWVRGETRGGQGLYLVDTIDRAAPQADTYNPQQTGGQMTDTVSAADPTNPRIDQVVLEVADQQHSGGSNLAQIRVVPGTPTGGATLDNRNGAASLPANAILLADLNITAALASVLTANIRDRRGFPLLGGAPPAFSALDAVEFQPAPGQLVLTGNIQSTATIDSQQGCALMYLPRRIVGATKIRFRYQQGATANATNFNLGIYDATGQWIIETGATAYAGALNTIQNVSVTIAATTFEAGYYWIALGNAAGTASGSVNATAVIVAQTNVPAANAPNLVGFAASGGTVMPKRIATGFTDQNTIANVTVTQRVAVPIPTLSVG